MELALADGEASLLPAFLGAAESRRLFDRLREDTPWRQESIALYGRRVPQPRLIAWYGDAGRHYAYSGLALKALPWTPALARLKARVEKAAGAPFNSALLNLYRDGHDSVDWHSDDEAALGPRPVIASVSLGGARRFQLKHRTRRDLEPVTLELQGGDLLLMRGTTQRRWRHRVPKTTKPVEPRINVTFRRIV